MIATQAKISLEKYIRNIPDFPKKGVLFRDITTLLNNKKGFKECIDTLAQAFKDKEIDYIVAAEARGFIFAGALSYALNCGFVPIRKPGKLPYKTYKATYSLEYGKDSLEMHKDAFSNNAKVLVFDDVLATGGTMLAMVNLVKKLKADIVGLAFLIEITGLKGREKLKDYPVTSIIKF